MRASKRIRTPRLTALLLCLALASALLLPVAALAQAQDKVVRVGWYETPYNQTDPFAGARATPTSISRRSPPTPAGPTST